LEYRQGQDGFRFSPFSTLALTPTQTGGYFRRSNAVAAWRWPLNSVYFWD
jgi:hypothetical protein